MYIPSQTDIYYDDPDLLWRLTAYMEVIITHARIDYLRRRDRHKPEIPFEDLSEEQEAYHQDLLSPSNSKFNFEEDKHTDAFSRLNSLRQSILTLIFVEGLSVQETADRLKCPAKKVYLEKHRAIRALRDQLIEEANPHGE